MACPPEGAITAFVSRSLSAPVAARLEAHLADCADCRHLAFALALESEGSRGEAGEPAPVRIGRFEVIGSAGAGAMGQVYRALDPELGRHVAIKVRHGHALVDASGEDRLRLEAQALARLTHPNVVAVYEAGRHERTAYVAMEYVEGVTLDVWLSTPRRQREVIEALAGAGRGLAAAHAAGLVHRDVKPHNIFVSAAGLAKVGDFGLVRVDRAAAAGPDPDTADQPADVAMTLSLTGSLVGTPAYMAPEQLAGDTATEASDQFSYCVTLFEALYGARPFTGETIEQILAAAARGPAIPATPRVPGRVRRALARGLRFDPGERFGSMTALLAALTGPTADRWLAVGAAAGLAAVLAVAATHVVADDDPCAVPDAGARKVFEPGRLRAIETALAARDPETTPAALAVGRLLADYGRRWSAADAASCRATATGDQTTELRDRQRACLERRLQRADDLGLLLSAPAEAKVLTSAANAVQSLPDPAACTRVDALLTDQEPPAAGQAVAVAALERRVDRMVNLDLVGQAALASREIEEVVAAARAAHHGPLLARALLAQVSIDVSLERFDRLEALIDEAAREAASARADELVAQAWTARVTILADKLGRVDDARAWVAVADAAIRRAGDPPEVRALLHTHVGWLLVSRGEYARARAEFEKALAVRERSGPVPKWDVARVENRIASTFLREGKTAEAEEHYRRALALFREVYGDLHPDVITVLNNLGGLLGATDPKRALAYLDEGRALGERLLGPNSVSVATSLSNMSIAHNNLREFEEAIRLQRRVLDIFRVRLGPGHPKVAYSLANLGQALLSVGDHAGAVEALRESVAILAAALGPDDALLARARSGLGDVLQAAGDDEGAVAAYREALASYDTSQEADGEEAAVVRVDLANILEARGDTAAARRQFERAYPALAEVTGENRNYALMALAGIVACDARDGKPDRARLAELEKLEKLLAAGQLTAEASGFESFARARAYAALGDRARARALARSSREGFTHAALLARRDAVDRWLMALR